MSVFIVFLYAVVVVLSLLLIGLVLIQPAKSGGMGAAFGGIGESVFGAKAGSHLTKATVVMTTLFFVLTLVLAALIGRGKWRSTTDWSDKIDKVRQPEAARPQPPAQPGNSIVVSDPRNGAAPAVGTPQSGRNARPAVQNSSNPKNKTNVKPADNKKKAKPEDNKKKAEPAASQTTGK